MDAATVSLITAIIGLLIKFLPDLEQIGQEIVTLFNSGKTLSESDLAKIQAFTDQLIASGRAQEAAILNVASQVAAPAPVPAATQTPAPAANPITPAQGTSNG